MDPIIILMIVLAIAGSMGLGIIPVVFSLSIGLAAYVYIGPVEGLVFTVGAVMGGWASQLLVRWAQMRMASQMNATQNIMKGKGK